MIHRNLSVATVMLASAVGCASTNGVNGPVTTADRADLSPADSARLCLRAGRDFERQGYDREAIAQYERARGFDPVATAVATRRLAVLYGRAGDPTRARPEYDAALAASPDDALLLNDAGYFHLGAGDLDGAERLLRRAVAADPHYGRAWVNLGLALAAAGRADDSYAAFATTLPPAEARANVGVALARHGWYREAEASLRQAVSQGEMVPQAQVALQWVEDQLGRSSTGRDAGVP